MNKPWFCLMGPTASGKTALACELIQHFPFEIVSIDSAMIYQGMDIGSAKPDQATLTQAPHHLIDLITPEEAYSVAQSYEDVVRCGRAIEARGHIPLLVGGTMMYFRALQQGLSDLPASDPTTREALLQQAEQRGWPYLYEQLAQCDPQAALRIHAHDKQRILRALEVYQLSQQSLSDLWQQHAPKETIRYCSMILMPDDRAWLHQRIAERFLKMIEDGFIDEVQQLQQRWSLTADLPSMRCVGYRQIWDYLEHGNHTQLVDQGTAATRQLAKRQLTWLRHWPDATYFAAENPSNIREMIALIQRITHNDG